MTSKKQPHSEKGHDEKIFRNKFSFTPKNSGFQSEAKKKRESSPKTPISEWMAKKQKLDHLIAFELQDEIVDEKAKSKSVPEKGSKDKENSENTHPQIKTKFATGKLPSKAQTRYPPLDAVPTINKEESLKKELESKADEIVFKDAQIQSLKEHSENLQLKLLQSQIGYESSPPPDSPTINNNLKVPKVSRKLNLEIDGYTEEPSCEIQRQSPPLPSPPLNPLTSPSKIVYSSPNNSQENALISPRPPKSPNNSQSNDIDSLHQKSPEELIQIIIDLQNRLKSKEQHETTLQRKLQSIERQNFQTEVKEHKTSIANLKGLLNFERDKIKNLEETNQVLYGTIKVLERQQEEFSLSTERELVTLSQQLVGPNTKNPEEVVKHLEAQLVKTFQVLESYRARNLNNNANF